MNAPAPLITIPDIIGIAFAGGFYAGRYLEGDQLCLLIVSPKAGDLGPAIWNRSLKPVIGAASYSDGMSNTRAMAEAGSKLAQQVLALDIGGETDWHLPARDQLELLYRHFKPTTYETYGGRNGDNPSSVPPGYPYTAKTVLQTGFENFREGGADAFADAYYWSSTQHASLPAYAWCQHFLTTYQNWYHNALKFRARAVRRLKI